MTNSIIDELIEYSSLNVKLLWIFNSIIHIEKYANELENTTINIYENALQKFLAEEITKAEFINIGNKFANDFEMNQENLFNKACALGIKIIDNDEYCKEVLNLLLLIVENREKSYNEAIIKNERNWQLNELLRINKTI